MIEYHVVLVRHAGSSKPNVTIFYDESKAAALREMRNYYNKNGFSIIEDGKRFSIADIVLVETERVAGAPILNKTPYIDLFDENGNRKDASDRGGSTRRKGEI